MVLEGGYQQGVLDSDWHLHLGKIEAKGGDPRRYFVEMARLLLPVPEDR